MPDNAEWTGAQLRPQLCLPGRHSPARLLYVRMVEPVWRCTCTRCGHQWEEPVDAR